MKIQNEPHQMLTRKQMIQAYYDQSGSLVMGPRTGTPMRLVSPAPVLVPPGAQARAPQSMYPPQQTAQQNLYSQQNGSSVGGNIYFHIVFYLIRISYIFDKHYLLYSSSVSAIIMINYKIITIKTDIGFYHFSFRFVCFMKINKAICVQ